MPSITMTAYFYFIFIDASSNTSCRKWYFPSPTGDTARQQRVIAEIGDDLVEVGLTTTSTDLRTWMAHAADLFASPAASLPAARYFAASDHMCAIVLAHSRHSLSSCLNFRANTS